MKCGFFDTGVCGIMTTGYIGTIDSKTEEATSGVTFENALPVGTRVVYLAAICSDDMEGATNITAGTADQEDLYASAHAISKGKGGAAHPDLPLVKDGTIKAKVDSAVTTGTVDIYATVIRLEA